MGVLVLPTQNATKRRSVKHSVLSALSISLIFMTTLGAAYDYAQLTRRKLKAKKQSKVTWHAVEAEVSPST